MIINIPPENCQRIDETWKYDGVHIIGNHQCMGNGFEDFMTAVSMEFRIRTLAPGNTYNYYAIFSNTYKQTIKRPLERHHYFYNLYHATALNLIFTKNKLPIKVFCKSTKNLMYALNKLKQTKRIILLSINSAVGRHIIRVNNFNEKTGELDCNDPFGKNPYTRDRIGGFKIYTYDELYKMGINSVCWIEDV
jgi:hypothetical protein